MAWQYLPLIPFQAKNVYKHRIARIRKAEVLQICFLLNFQEPAFARGYQVDYVTNNQLANALIRALQMWYKYY